MYGIENIYSGMWFVNCVNIQHIFIHHTVDVFQKYTKKPK